VDNVGRATITINPDLGLDEIGIPREMAWDIFDTKLHRHLVRKGFSPADAALSLRDRDDHAKRALEDVVPNHPVQYSRAPAWHQFSTLGAMPKLFDGNTIQINPLLLTLLLIEFMCPLQDSFANSAAVFFPPCRLMHSNRNPPTMMNAFPQFPIRLEIEKAARLSGRYSLPHNSGRIRNSFPPFYS